MNAKLILALLAPVLVGAPAGAAEKFALDKAHSSFVFSINHLGIANVFGRFNDVDGEFTFDAENLAANQVKITVHAKSVDTNHQRRDDHLRSPDFFNAAEFPTLMFVSKKVEKLGERTGKLIGDLTLLGVSKEVAFDVTFNKLAPHPAPAMNGRLYSGFSARGTVKRSDFGMKFGVPGIGDDVSLIIEIEAGKI